jgi:hypothetical protein
LQIGGKIILEKAVRRIETIEAIDTIEVIETIKAIPTKKRLRRRASEPL